MEDKEEKIPLSSVLPWIDQMNSTDRSQVTPLSVLVRHPELFGSTFVVPHPLLRRPTTRPVLVEQPPSGTGPGKTASKPAEDDDWLLVEKSD